MKRFFALATVSLFLCTTALQAQNLTVKGDVFDEQKQPVIYASVALLDPDSTSLETGTITDDQRHFQLPDIKPGFISLKSSLHALSINKLQ